MKFRLTLFTIIIISVSLHGYSQTSTDPVYIYSDKDKSFFVTAYLENIVAMGNCGRKLNYVIKTKGVCPQNMLLKWNFTYYDCNRNEASDQYTLRLKKGSQNTVERRSLEVLKIKSLIEGDYILNYIIPPENFSITGPEMIKEGQSATLQVNRGGDKRNVKWIWYRESESKPFETGSTISVAPERTTRYYLKAEQDGFFSGVKSFLLNVKMKPIPPKDFVIKGSEFILEGDTTSLSVETKTYVSDIIWNWYKQVGSSREYVGRGNTILVCPKESAYYSVQGDLDGKKSDFKNFIVQVRPVPEPPADFSIRGPISIQEGESATLQVIPGKDKLENVRWLWYKEGENNPMAEGEMITIRPDSNTRYYLIARVHKKNSTRKGHELKVILRSQPPSIAGDTLICRGYSKYGVYSIRGGRLGTGSKKWQWYKGKCGQGIAIGSGNEIEIMLPSLTTSYYVMPDNDNTVCREFTIEVHDSPLPVFNFTAPYSVCQDRSFDLTATGYQLKKDEKYIWYTRNEGSEHKIRIGEGDRLRYSLNSDAEIFLCVETGFCKSPEISRRISVVKPPSYWGYILNTGNRRKKYTLKAIDVPEKEGYIVRWYLGECNGREIGSGNGIKVKVKSANTVVYMRPERDCDSLRCSSISLTYSKLARRKYFFINFGAVSNSYRLIQNGSLAIGSKNLYLRAKINFNRLESILDKNKKVVSTFKCNNNQLIDYPSNTGTYYQFNGLEENVRESYTLGVMFGFPSVRAYIGGGYGKRKLLWGTTLYQYSDNRNIGTAWAINTEASIEGPEFEGGLFVKMGAINLMGGISVVNSRDFTNRFIDMHLGFGFNFHKKRK